MSLIVKERASRVAVIMAELGAWDPCGPMDIVFGAGC